MPVTETALKRRRDQFSLEKLARIADLAAAYFQDYFRAVPLVEVSVDLRTIAEKIIKEAKSAGIDIKTDDSLRKKLHDALAKALRTSDEAKLDANVQFAIDEQFQSITLKGFVLDPGSESSGFVARNGDRLAFHTIQISIDPMHPKLDLGEIDFKGIGNDLVRILIEAVFDAVCPVPGVPSASGVRMPGSPVPKYDPAAYPNVSPEEFTIVNDWGNRAEALVGSAVAKLVRGISLFSLNNEALASLVETLLSVTSRKVAEKAVWKIVESTTVLQTAGRTTDLELALRNVRGVDARPQDMFREVRFELANGIRDRGARRSSTPR
jgi:hypothetical protein